MGRSAVRVPAAKALKQTSVAQVEQTRDPFVFLAAILSTRPAGLHARTVIAHAAANTPVTEVK